MFQLKSNTIYTKSVREFIGKPRYTSILYCVYLNFRYAQRPPNFFLRVVSCSQFYTCDPLWSKPPDKNEFVYVLSNYRNGGETEGLKLLYGGKIFDMTSEGNNNHILKAKISYYYFLYTH